MFQSRLRFPDRPRHAAERMPTFRRLDGFLQMLYGSIDMLALPFLKSCVGMAGRIVGMFD